VSGFGLGDCVFPSPDPSCYANNTTLQPSQIPEIVDPTTGEPYLTLQDVQNAVNSGFQSATAATTSLTAWIQQNPMIIYGGAAALFVLALFGGGGRRR
jgi:hypothetical protein